MTSRRVGVFLGLVGLSALAADPPATGTASNDKLEIQASVYVDKAAMSGLLGQEMEEGVIIVEVRLTPKGSEPIKVWRDDFLLRSDKDGQKSTPFDPSQIAGNTVLTLVRTYSADGVLVEDRGPVWGGIGGSRPRRMPGPSGGIGNATTGQETNEARVGPAGDDADNPLLAVLKAKVLKEEEITGPVSGLLYFPMDGKHKVKQLELHYRGQAGALDLRFKKPK
jgi:hypothetical protein